MSTKSEKWLEQIRSEQSKIARLQEKLAEHEAELSTYEKELWVKDSTDFFKECIKIIEDRPPLIRGWRARPASRLVVVYYLYEMAKKEKKYIFEVLDGLYTFVKGDRVDVPEFDGEDATAIINYLDREEYWIEEEKIRDLPIDTQILLITKKAFEVLQEHGTFRRFARTVVRDQDYYGPN